MNQDIPIIETWFYYNDGTPGIKFMTQNGSVLVCITEVTPEGDEWHRVFCRNKLTFSTLCFEKAMSWANEVAERISAGGGVYK